MLSTEPISIVLTLYIFLPEFLSLLILPIGTSNLLECFLASGVSSFVRILPTNELSDRLNRGSLYFSSLSGEGSSKDASDLKLSESVSSLDCCRVACIMSGDIAVKLMPACAASYLSKSVCTYYERTTSTKSEKSSPCMREMQRSLDSSHAFLNI